MPNITIGNEDWMNSTTDMIDFEVMITVIPNEEKRDLTTKAVTLLALISVPLVLFFIVVFCSPNSNSWVTVDKQRKMLGNQKISNRLETRNGESATVKLENDDINEEHNVNATEI